MNLNNATDLIKMELGGIYGASNVAEMSEIIKYYDIYEKGQDWEVKARDYTPTKKKTNYIKKLIKEEARFMFGKTPLISILSESEGKEEACTQLEEHINKVLKANLFSSKLIKGARDCFIGKRVAIKLHADTVNKQIRIMFVPSLEFVYEPFEDRIDELKKIIFFHEVTEDINETDKSKQRFWKQRYEMVNGKCLLYEAFVDGYGDVIEVISNNIDLKLSGIPCYVILNDGLSGDLQGESDVAELAENQLAYNKITSEDIDALLKGMNRIIWGKDIKDTSGFSLAPGAFWDVQSSPIAVEGGSAELGIISTDFGYDNRMKDKRNELLQDMHNVLNVPNVSLEDLKGFATSGKSMKALYWQLIVRCEEKLQDWRPALEWMVKAILEMSNVYNVANIPKIDDIIVNIENQYPLQEDEDNEKLLDMQQVISQVMSRKTYIERWGNVPSDEELKQIQLEKSMLEDSIGMIDEEVEEVE